MLPLESVLPIELYELVVRRSKSQEDMVRIPDAPMAEIRERRPSLVAFMAFWVAVCHKGKRVLRFFSDLHE